MTDYYTVASHTSGISNTHLHSHSLTTIYCINAGYSSLQAMSFKSYSHAGHTNQPGHVGHAGHADNGDLCKAYSLCTM